MVCRELSHGMFFPISIVLWNFKADKSGLLFFYQSYQMCFHFFRDSTIVLISFLSARLCTEYPTILYFSGEARSFLGITKCEDYNYLNMHRCYLIDGTDDTQDFNETVEAMETIGLGKKYCT